MEILSILYEIEKKTGIKGELVYTSIGIDSFPAYSFIGKERIEIANNSEGDELEYLAIFPENYETETGGILFIRDEDAENEPFSITIDELIKKLV